MKVLEIGASSMLDNELTKDWYKIFNVHEPTYGNAIKSDSITEIPDVAIISMGYKYTHRQISSNKELIGYYKSFIYYPSGSKSWYGCVEVPYEIIVNKLSDAIGNNKVMLVYLNSISTLPEVPYPHQADYVISKSALGILLKNLCYLDDRFKLLDIHLSAVKSRMCNEGMDSVDVTRDIIDSIEMNIDDNFKYKSITIDTFNQIKDLIK